MFFKSKELILTLSYSGVLFRSKIFSFEKISVTIELDAESGLLF